VPEEHASRGARSWMKLCNLMGWDNDSELRDVKSGCEGAEMEVSENLTRRRSSGDGDVVSQIRVQLAPSKL
jgi:hypothetical protein